MTRFADTTVYINNRPVVMEGERNLLELIRKTGIDLPTFCYQSDLSVYGSCRLCLVEIEGRGIVGSCSTPPEAGMRVHTHTEEIRELRKIAIELFLANHDSNCPTCLKSDDCQLQNLARRLGVDAVRFQSVLVKKPIDNSSPAIIRDPNKCVLCGDCARMCSEIQGIGAIDFAHRGHDAAVLPAFGKKIGEVECVNCGQCTIVCPTGSLCLKPEMEEVWKSLTDKQTYTVAAIAPAVRVAIGEIFGMEAGAVSTGQMLAALKLLGFDQVYDVSFAADLTTIEEGSEFLERRSAGVRLPHFTSCCPAWVKYVEHFHPHLIGNLSTCKSPLQMFGALLKDRLPDLVQIPRERVKVVSITPCTAKKFEAKRPEFTHDGIPDIDHVITTIELGRMIKAAGIQFNDLSPESFDMPFGFSTSAGVIFGNSGGVTEAVLRFTMEKLSNKPLAKLDFVEVRGESGIREASFDIGGSTIRFAIVHGLKNAKMLITKIAAGKCAYDFVEVMACPQGCINGGGQPVNHVYNYKQLRTRGLFTAGKMFHLHKPQDNIMVNECYQQYLGDVGGAKAQQLLHTHYKNRRRQTEDGVAAGEGAGVAPTTIGKGHEQQ
ncbi:2Fe-2S iron-sulfur cluster binding domain-containing protein [Pelobacter propionicus]|uniref:NAD(P)-dependent iron-only hydrogenase catalytic subunit n=1 Tax=Pelobacter propionicus (strain DSM 2379 / NBRC 103807 / OttBd1) TaxID=338966 RepID=A1AP36_PELPD|nr:2Fe-2S iron-sulfur cluster binding domain-containing protein [Pelobacter propionicus]ABK99106.1 NAD(P)-dependent iron-only hydrogenase catalytic subunit [Pelobacter propionicus DSM 2379]